MRQSHSSEVRMEEYAKLINWSPSNAIEESERFKKFDGPLDIRYDYEASAKLGKDYYRVLSPFKYHIGPKHDNRWIVIPAGYLTDLTSVPKIFHSFVTPGGKHAPAAVVHDILLEYRCCIKYTPGIGYKFELLSVKDVNDIFNEALKVLSIDEIYRYPMVWATRLNLELLKNYRELPEPRKTKLQLEWTEN